MEEYVFSAELSESIARSGSADRIYRHIARTVKKCVRLINAGRSTAACLAYKKMVRKILLRCRSK